MLASVVIFLAVSGWSGPYHRYSAVAEQGYPSLTYLDTEAFLKPAELLFLALHSRDLASRVAEALPWLPFRVLDMKWHWPMREAKLRDRGNRMAYLPELALQVSDALDDPKLAHMLARRVSAIGRSRLASGR